MTPMTVPILTPRADLQRALASGGSRTVTIGGADTEVDPDAVPPDGMIVSVFPVTEAVKVVEDMLVVTGVDRTSVVHVGLPMALHRETLARILAEDRSDQIDLASAVFRRGGEIVAWTDLPA